ncbi:MAG TPA: ribokinase, partial [Phycisphaerales bacterium]|nr:ribokinase [Phycisphaerales bacterium]
MNRQTILVVGSINMDLVVRSPHMPAPGETVLGNGFVTNPGGKGANQAVAAARLGGPCAMIGRVGDDEFGRTLTARLAAEKIDCANVLTTEGVPTGVAMIVVDSHGENSIVVASGANYRLSPDDLFCREEAFARAAVVVLQLELPLPTVRAACDLARRNGCRIVMDPAPATPQLDDALCAVDILSPNVSEAEILTGKKAGEDRVDKIVAMDLIARGAKAAVLKLGARGSLVVTNDGHFYRVPSYKVNVVDTTAAGDAFTAALAVALAHGNDLHSAARFANAAGALACTKFGAQATMPTADEVRILMA